MRRTTTLIAGVAAMLMVASAPTWGHDLPPSNITVTPSTNLVNGQNVNVSGTGFGLNGTITIEECSADSVSCKTLSNTAVTDNSGAFPNTTVTVLKTFTGDNGPVDCAVSGCIIHARDPGVATPKHATETITFIPSGGGDGNGDGNGDGPNVPPELTCGGLKPTLVGTDASNVLVGTAGNDVIAGLGGDDIVFGLGGNDIVCGGEDDDTLKGGRGKDILYGQEGGDTLNGGAQKDHCFGDTGIDRARKCEKAHGL